MMTIGDGLFLSSLFLGFVLLYIFTRDRWKWKKIVLRSLVVVIGIAFLLSVGIYAYTEYENRPQRAESLWGVRVGESRGDVKFAKGEPSQSENKNDPSKKDHLWVYELDPGLAYAVYFKEDKVTRVLAFGKRLSLPSVSGISVYASLDDITKKLGPPSYISRSKDELKRSYSFAKFNVAFGIERGEMNMVAVGVTEEWPVRLADDAP